MDRLLYPGKRIAAVVGQAFSAIVEDWLIRLNDRADTAYRGHDLAASFPVGLTITGVASNATITTSAHTRRYYSADVTVEAGLVAGASYGSTYYLYYDDAKRAGGLVTITATTTRTDAAASSDNPHRHYVGKVIMPATAGASNTTGTNAYPPGHT